MTIVKDIMTRHVETSTPNAPLSDACRIMWQHDCGAVPVVDPTSGQLCGIVTDRDAAMASYLRHRPLNEIPIGVAMSADPCTCRDTDDVSKVHDSMGERQVRRMPVLDDAGRLVGVVSLNDLVHVASKAGGNTHKLKLAETLAAISRQRPKPDWMKQAFEQETPAQT